MTQTATSGQRETPMARTQGPCSFFRTEVSGWVLRNEGRRPQQAGAVSAAGALSWPRKQARHSAVTASPPEGHGHGGTIVPVHRDLLGAGKPAPRRGSVGGFL